MKLLKKLNLEKSSIDGNYILLTSYLGSPFRDFDSYLRSVVGLEEDDVQLTLKQYKSNFVTQGLTPGIYTIKDNSEAVYAMGDHEGFIQCEYDDVSMKRQLTFYHIGTLRFYKNSFFDSLLGFAAYWD